MHDPTMKLEELRLSMAEAAGLPADDPRRVAVMRDVLAAGPEARRAWVEMIADDEQLRLDLVDMDVPPGLMDRLMQIPEAHPEAAPIQLVTTRRWRVPVAIAATLVMAGLVWVAVTAVNSGREPAAALATHDSELDLRLKTLAVLALDHYHAKSQPQATAANVHELAHKVASPTKVNFEMRPPELPPHMKIVSVGQCAIGGHPVVCYHVEDNGRMRTIYQFSTKDYLLPMDIEPRVITPPGPWYDRRKSEVTFWTDEKKAYAIVNPGGEDDGEGPSTSGI